MTSYCFDCGGDDRHLQWCPTFAPRPIDWTEPRPRARGSDPATSHAAAASVVNLSDTKRRILDILTSEPSTDFEISARWHANGFPTISDSGLRTRRSELVDAGLLLDSGSTRPGPSGRAYVVWTVVHLSEYQPGDNNE